MLHFLQFEGKDIAMDYASIAPEQIITDDKENSASSNINLCLMK